MMAFSRRSSTLKLSGRSRQTRNRQLQHERSHRTGSFAPASGFAVAAFGQQLKVLAPPPALPCPGAPRPCRYSPQQDRLLASVPNGKIIVELFSGSGHLAQAFARRGIEAWAYDIKDCLFNDLLRPEPRREVEHLILSRRAAYVHMGMPCNTWSLARRPGGPPPLRDSNMYIYGLANLKGKNLVNVLNANDLLEWSCKMFKLCQQSGVPVSLENPRTSRCWITPEAEELKKRGARPAHTTFCAFGTEWRKGTTFLQHGLGDIQGVLPICKKVRILRAGSRKLQLCCQYTRCRHKALDGIDEHTRMFHTFLAQAYPERLCDVIADFVVDKVFAFSDASPRDNRARKRRMLYR